MSARRLTIAAAAACLAAAFVGHALFFGFVADDAYISFVYARNLAEFGQPVFNAGTDNPVEGYTNFLWVAVLAGLWLLGLAPEIAAQVLGLGFGLSTLAVALVWGRRWFGANSGWTLAAPALLASSSGFACWASGGLETQMFTFWVSLALYAYVVGRDEPAWTRRLGWILGLAAMTRPEGLLVAAVLGGHRVISAAIDRRPVVPNRDERICLGWFLALWAPYFAWRWSYYGFPFPNTYYVKAGEASAAYHEQLRAAGWYYAGQWARQSGALYALPLVVAGAAAGRRTFATAAVALITVYLVYAVRVGGDFMGLYRFVLPLLVPVALLVVLGLRFVAERLGRWSENGFRVGLALALLVVVAHVAGQARLSAEAMRPGNWASDRGIDTPSYLDVYARDRATIGRHMGPCMRDDDFSIFGGAGAKPYTGRMRGIDVFGLVSERVAHEVAPSRPRAGHNKWAPDRLLVEYEPTFVFSCYSIHADPSRPSLNCNPRFWLQRGYRQVTLHVPGLEQQGEYYTFLVREDRNFECPGLLRR